MVFVIAKIANEILPLFIDGWAVVDFNVPQWHLPFQMNSFDAKIFKGLKKDELMDIASRMRLRLQKSNKFNKVVDKNIGEMKDTIKDGWPGYFAAPSSSSGQIAAPSSSTVEIAVPSSSSGEIAGDIKKQKGMYNHGSMIECLECHRSWSINQGFECVVCRRSWTRTGPSLPSLPKDTSSISVDLIDLLDFNCGDIIDDKGNDNDKGNDDDKGKLAEIISNEDVFYIKCLETCYYIIFFLR